MTALLRGLVLPLAVLLVLGACAGSDDEPGTYAPTPMPTPVTVTPTAEPVRGLPAGITAGTDSPAGVAVDSNGDLHVITFGSSSNPAVVHEFVVDGQDVTVDVSAVEGRPATMDFTPTYSPIELPETVDLDEPIVFELGAFGSVTLESTEPGTSAWIMFKE